jgi:hypothetical protein
MAASIARSSAVSVAAEAARAGLACEPRLMGSTIRGVLDLGPSIEGWNEENAAGLRQLTLAVRFPRSNGESVLVAALEAERGITHMQLDPPM